MKILNITLTTSGTDEYASMLRVAVRAVYGCKVDVEPFHGTATMATRFVSVEGIPTKTEWDMFRAKLHEIDAMVLGYFVTRGLRS